MNRREFNKMMLLSGAMLPTINGCEQLLKHSAPLPSTNSNIDYSHLSLEQVNQLSLHGHETLMAEKGFKMMGQEKIAMLMFPGFNALDLIGPHYLFSGMMGAQIYLVSTQTDLTPVASGGGMKIVPTHTMMNCPDDLDVLFVPGAASGVINAMQNPSVLAFLRQKAKTAGYVTSVCTGSLLLGKAGLLKGKKATSHWLTLDLLPKLGAIPVKQRVVWDGNVVTGGGVTAGIDFGLEIVAAFRSATYAEALQLDAEYNPAPPFNSGSPDTARPLVRDAFVELYSPFLQQAAVAIDS